MVTASLDNFCKCAHSGPTIPPDLGRHGLSWGPILQPYEPFSNAHLVPEAPTHEAATVMPQNVDNSSFLI